MLFTAKGDSDYEMKSSFCDKTSLVLCEMENLMEHVLFEMENLSFIDWLRVIPFFGYL